MLQFTWINITYNFFNHVLSKNIFLDVYICLRLFNKSQMQNKIVKSYQVKVNNLVVQLALFNVLNEDSWSSNLYFQILNYLKN